MKKLVNNYDNIGFNNAVSSGTLCHRLSWGPLYG